MAYEALVDSFQDGDIIYGLDGPRGKAVKELMRIQKLYAYGNYMPYEKQILMQNHITNAIWDPSKPNKYARDREIKKHFKHKKEEERVIGFKKFLKGQKPRRNITKLKDEEKKYSDFLRGHLGWVRASKGGLEFQMLKRNRMVHFVIEEVDLRMVMGRKGAQNQMDDGITNHELRWLYRHRHESYLIANLRLYTENEEVLLEDFFGKQEWESYHPKTHILR